MSQRIEHREILADGLVKITVTHKDIVHHTVIAGDSGAVSYREAVGGQGFFTVHQPDNDGDESLLESTCWYLKQGTCYASNRSGMVDWIQSTLQAGYKTLDDLLINEYNFQFVQPAEDTLEAPQPAVLAVSLEIEIPWSTCPTCKGEGKLLSPNPAQLASLAQLALQSQRFSDGNIKIEAIKALKLRVASLDLKTAKDLIEAAMAVETSWNNFQ